MRVLTSGLFGGQSGQQWKQDGALVRLEGGAERADDAAWLRITGDLELVFASDYVRGTEFLLFTLGVLDFYDIGYYLAAANISDLAAMGAQPIAMTSVVRYPRSLPDSEFFDILRGIRDCCENFGSQNVGGDIGTAERVILSASAVGMVQPSKTLTRSGAKPGDRVLLSAATGVALAAMIYFDGKMKYGWELSTFHEDRLATAWKRVQPEVQLGMALSASGIGTSCQDTSDGLRATIEQLEAASRVRVSVDLERVPIDDSVRVVAELAGLPVMDIVFGGSVDFRLLFTVAPHNLSLVPSTASVIGTVTDGSPPGPALPGFTWSHQSDPLSGYRQESDGTTAVV